MTTRDEALAALTAHREAGNVPRGQPDPVTLQLVADCLNATPPATWGEIGKAAGQAGPNAHRKYMPHLVETRHWTVKTTPGTETPPVSFLTRLLNPATDTRTETHPAVNAPLMPITTGVTRMAFQPEKVVVTYRDGRFRCLEISGPTVGFPDFHTIRRFERERDVPDWARRYITAD